jgi:hypothetical protein
MDAFTRAYIEAALWSSEDDFGEPLERNYDAAAFAPEALHKIEQECADFQEDNAELLSRHWDAAQAGHDFWLTRNGHGTGFWDRGHGKAGEILTQAAHRAGERTIYDGDDGKLYHD